MDQNTLEELGDAVELLKNSPALNEKDRKIATLVTAAVAVHLGSVLLRIETKLDKLLENQNGATKRTTNRRRPKDLNT